MSQYTFNTVHVYIKQEFFVDNELTTLEEARKRSDFILRFLKNTIPMLHFFEAKEHLKNPRIFEYHNVPARYVIETCKYIESNEDLKKYVMLNIDFAD